MLEHSNLLYKELPKRTRTPRITMQEVHVNPAEVHHMDALQGGPEFTATGKRSYKKLDHLFSHPEVNGMLHGHMAEHKAQGGSIGRHEHAHAANGRYGDTEVVEMPHRLIHILNKAQGRATHNPWDGKPEYFLGGALANFAGKFGPMLGKMTGKLAPMASKASGMIGKGANAIKSGASAFGKGAGSFGRNAIARAPSLLSKAESAVKTGAGALGRGATALGQGTANVLGSGLRAVGNNAGAITDIANAAIPAYQQFKQAKDAEAQERQMREMQAEQMKQPSPFAASGSSADPGPHDLGIPYYDTDDDEGFYDAAGTPGGIYQPGQR